MGIYQSLYSKLPYTVHLESFLYDLILKTFFLDCFLASVESEILDWQPTTLYVLLLNS